MQSIHIMCIFLRFNSFQCHLCRMDVNPAKYIRISQVLVCQNFFFTKLWLMVLYAKASNTLHNVLDKAFNKIN